MAMRLAVRQMNGKVLLVEVTSDTTVGELKRRLKALHPSEDEQVRKMSTVDLVLGDMKLVNHHQNLVEAGISPDAVLSVLFSINPVECSSYKSSGYRAEDLLVVQIPKSVTSIGMRAFYGCSSLTSVSIPDSISVICCLVLLIEVCCCIVRTFSILLPY